jgi:hypothetical protein
MKYLVCQKIKTLLFSFLEQFNALQIKPLCFHKFVVINMDTCRNSKQSLSQNSTFFLICPHKGGGIRTSDYCFIKRGPSRLSYLLRTKLDFYIYTSL